jgi:hypothetical protein
MFNFIFNLVKAKAAIVGEHRKWKGGEFEKQAGGKWNRIEVQKHIRAALAQHGLNSFAIGTQKVKETNEDVEDYHKKVHEGGQDKKEFWKNWSEQYGVEPSSRHKSVVHLAHEMILQAHGVPSPSMRTKEKKKAESAGKPTPQFDLGKKVEKVEQKNVAQRKTFKVQSKIPYQGKMVDPLPETQSHQHRHMVEGDSGKDYLVSQRKSTGEWQCSCPAWKYHGHDCKHLHRHLDEIKENVKAGNTKPTARGMKRHAEYKKRNKEEESEGKGYHSSQDHDIAVERKNSAMPMKPKADSGLELARQMGIKLVDPDSLSDRDKRFIAFKNDPKNGETPIRQLHKEFMEAEKQGKHPNKKEREEAENKKPDKQQPGPTVTIVSRPTPRLREDDWHEYSPKRDDFRRRTKAKVRMSY